MYLPLTFRYVVCKEWRNLTFLHHLYYIVWQSVNSLVKCSLPIPYKLCFKFYSRVYELNDTPYHNLNLACPSITKLHDLYKQQQFMMHTCPYCAAALTHLCRKGTFVPLYNL